MSKPQVIKVTRQCIDEGAIGSTDSCPIALAFVEAGFEVCSVGDSEIELILDGKDICLSTPAKLANFIDHFDSIPEGDEMQEAKGRAKMKPFSFKFIPPISARIKV